MDLQPGRPIPIVNRGRVLVAMAGLVASALIAVVVAGVAAGEVQGGEVLPLIAGIVLSGSVALLALMGALRLATGGTDLGSRPRPALLIAAVLLGLYSVTAYVASGRFIDPMLGWSGLLAGPLSFLLAGGSLRPAGSVTRGAFLGAATYLVTGIPVTTAIWALLEGDIGELVTSEIFFLAWGMLTWPGFIWGFAHGWIGA